MPPPVTPDALPERPETEGNQPMRRVTALLASLALVLSMAPAVALAAPSTTGSWIVTLRSDVDSAGAAPALARAHGGEVGHIYQHAFNGFSFRGSAAAAAAMGRNPQVARVEADAEVWLDTTHTNATWGLDRIDQRSSSLDGSYTYNATGAGVTAYVIDSGILTGHQEFAGRATLGRDLIGTNGGQDCNGHGTHVAGTIGGSTYGVAKAVSLIAVRVFDCTGGSSWSTIIAGVDWVTSHHTTAPAVANMSLGGGASSSVDDAVRGMIADGVATAVAAGNGDFFGRQANACNYSPARVAEAMTVSATDKADKKASWANYGNCVDWFAPGVSITSAWIDSNSDTHTISGTSMATPHTAGVAALYLQANPGATPATVRTAIYDATSKGVVTSSNTTNNHLLYSLLADGGGDPPAQENQNPTAADVALTVEPGQTATWSPVVDDPDDGDTLICALGATAPTQGTATLSSCAVDAGSYTADTGASGTDTFTYTVEDGQGGSDTGTVSVTISATDPPATGSITLTATPYKVKGLQKADLSWSGATNTNVDIFRNSAKITTTANDGAHTDDINARGGGTYTYQVCEAGTTSCSPVVSVSY